MNTFKFFPEGWKNETITESKGILQGIVEKCDENYNLYVKLDNGKKGIIPRKEVEAINIDENGLPKTNLCIGKVHKYVQFKVKGEEKGNLILSRKEAQKDVIDSIKNELKVGQTLNGIEIGRAHV